MAHPGISTDALYRAAKALYMAGRWTLSEDRLGAEEQAELWESLRSTLGLEPEVNTDEIVSGQTVSMTTYT